MPQAAPILANIAINLAIGIGASMLAEAFRPKPPQLVRQTTSRGMSFEVAVGESVPVSSIVGRARTGGFLTFAQEYGPNNEFAKFLFVNGKGRYDGSEGLLVDEKLRTLSGSNDNIDGQVVDDFTVDGVAHLWAKTLDGRPGQAADPGLIAAAPTRWTEAHKATGTPATIITIRQNPDLFGGTLPRFGFVWRGLRLYDWRYDSTMPGGEGDQRWDDPETWAWTENPYVIKWNFRRGIWVNGVRVLGLGFSQHANDLAYYTAAANLADETIVHPATEWEGARYTFGREIYDDEERLSVLRQLDEAGCGTSFDRGGADAPLPAQQHVATFTLGDEHLVDGQAAVKNLKGAVSLKRTAYHGSYIAANENWQTRPFGTRSSTALEELIGGTKLEPYDQPYEYRDERAQSRAQIQLNKNLFAATRTEVFGPRSNVLEIGDPFTRVMGDWGTMLAIVTAIQPVEGKGRMANRLSWRQWDNSIVPASGEDFITPPPAAGTGPVPPDRTLMVSGFNIVAYQKPSGGGQHPYAKASWTPITDPGVDRLIIRVWPTAGSEADDSEEFIVDAPLLQHTKTFGPLSALTEYSRTIWPVRKDGRATFSTNVGTFTTGAEVVPAEVADGSVTSVKLGQEERNRVNTILDEVQFRLNTHDEQLGDLAQVVLDNALHTQRKLTGLSLRSANAAASVTRLEEVILGPNGAFAQVTERVEVLYGNFYAGGFWRMTAEADEGTGVTLLSLGVKATNGEWTSIASAQFGAQVTVDGAESFINLMADRLGFLATSGEYVTQPFKVDAEFVELQAVKFVDLFSYDGTSLRIHGGGPGDEPYIVGETS